MFLNMLFTRLSPNKRSFKGPGGDGRRQGSLGAPRPVRGNWPLWPPGGVPWPEGGLPWFPVASRGLPWPPMVSSGLYLSFSNCFLLLVDYLLLAARIPFCFSLIVIHQPCLGLLAGIILLDRSAHSAESGVAGMAAMFACALLVEFLCFLASLVVI